MVLLFYHGPHGNYDVTYGPQILHAWVKTFTNIDENQIWVSDIYAGSIGSIGLISARFYEYNKSLHMHVHVNIPCKHSRNWDQRKISMPRNDPADVGF